MITKEFSLIYDVGVVRIIGQVLDEFYKPVAQGRVTYHLSGGPMIYLEAEDDGTFEFIVKEDEEITLMIVSMLIDLRFNAKLGNGTNRVWFDDFTTLEENKRFQFPQITFWG